MKKSLTLVMLIACTFLACQPGPNFNDLARGIVVSTNSASVYNPQTHTSAPLDYSQYSTYFLRLDTINYAGAGDTLQCSACSGKRNVLGTYPSVITDEIKSRMDVAGFKRVEAFVKPDLKIHIQLINYNSRNYLFIQIHDLMNNPPLFGQTMIWLCQITNLVSTPDVASVTAHAIDQAFYQSYYIKK